MKKNNGNTILVVDGGGRGSALVAAYTKSPHISRIIAVPGNDLMKLDAVKPITTYPQLKTTDVKTIVTLAQEKRVALVDVAQDNAVAAGLVNRLTKEGIPTIGPTKEAGQIEWDKAWAREFGMRHGIPQPQFAVFSSPLAGRRYIKKQPEKPVFIKAAYLAEGKGALPARNGREALQKITALKNFKGAGDTFLVEEWLEGEERGEEFSVFALSDGERFQIIGTAQDHKRALTFDEGENTGGMGCVSPPLIITKPLINTIYKQILAKTIAGLNREKRPYKGILYLGGMAIKQRGKVKPYVIEFNARWGDPEAQVIVPSIKNDLFEVGMATAQGNISHMRLRIDGKTRVVVTAAAKGYPIDYRAVKGKQIFGIDVARKLPGVSLYGAGVAVERGKYYAAGGRLFYIVGEGVNITEARRRAYEAMALIHIEDNNLQYRTDIGWRDMERLMNK